MVRGAVRTQALWPVERLAMVDTGRRRTGVIRLSKNCGARYPMIDTAR
jgi:hypothetical protein